MTTCTDIYKNKTDILPQLSVIIPYYNPPEDSFRDCIESIIAQDYLAYEVIVVDDGSDSSKASFLDKICGIDNRFKVFHELHKGASEARNKGLDEASGEYITFVDADDVLISGFFTDAMLLFNADEIDIAYGKVRRRYPSGISYEAQYTLDSGVLFLKDELLPWFRRLVLSGAAPLTLKNLRGFDSFSVAAKVYRKTLLDGIRFKSTLKWGEDSFFNSVAVHCAKAVAVTDSAWYQYNLRAGSSVRSSLETMLVRLGGFSEYLSAAPLMNWSLGDIGMRWLDAVAGLLQGNTRQMTSRELLSLAQKAMKAVDTQVLSSVSLEEYVLSKYRRLLFDSLIRGNCSIASMLLKLHSIVLGHKREIGVRENVQHDNKHADGGGWLNLQGLYGWCKWSPAC